jgi:hypothetical protein
LPTKQNPESKFILFRLKLCTVQTLQASSSSSSSHKLHHWHPQSSSFLPRSGFLAALTPAKYVVPSSLPPSLPPSLPRGFLTLLQLHGSNEPVMCPLGTLTYSLATVCVLTPTPNCLALPHTLSTLYFFFSLYPQEPSLTLYLLTYLLAYLLTSSLCLKSSQLLLWQIRLVTYLLLWLQAFSHCVCYFL